MSWLMKQNTLKMALKRWYEKERSLGRGGSSFRGRGRGRGSGSGSVRGRVGVRPTLGLGLLDTVTDG